MSETTQTPVVVQDPEKLKTYLQLRHDAAIADLDAIPAIETEEQYAAAMEVLGTAKQLYDAMYAKRKSYTDPIKKFIDGIMTFENAINYNATTDNHYTLARKKVAAYDQKKLDEKKLKEHEAWLRAEQLKYKAEFRAKVQQQLADMLGGLSRTLIQKFTAWESTLTLANIEKSEEQLRNQNPKLKQEDYDKCFHAWGKDEKVMTQKEELEYLEDLKKEFTYESYDEQYKLIVAPMKNEYLAKIPQVKVKLEEIAKADEASKKKLEDDRKAELDRQSQEAMKKSLEESSKRTQEISDQKDMGTMEASFVQQSMMDGVEAPPSKKVVTFSSANWLKPMLMMVSKVAVHPKFKASDTKGNLRKEIIFWCDQYASLVGEPIEGISITEEAKTVVRK